MLNDEPWVDPYGYWTWRKMVVVWGGLTVLAVAIIAGFLIAQATWWEDHKTERGRGDTRAERIDQDHADVYEMPDTFGNVATKCVGDGKRLWSSTKGGMFVTDDPDCPPTTWEIVVEDRDGD